MPVVSKVKGRATVEEMTHKIKSKVRARLSKNLQDIGLESWPTKLSMLAIKDEQILHIYTEVDGEIRKIKSYPFTAMSGTLGPKLKEGDRQIPEGIYEIDYLNPNSSFYLSMKINYPNAFDKAKGAEDGRTTLGNDIFIHGKSATIGCIPIGDEAIEELFYMVAKVKPKRIPIIIAPSDFRLDKSFPTIDHITWEEELYSKIKKAMQAYENN